MGTIKLWPERITCAAQAQQMSEKKAPEVLAEAPRKTGCMGVQFFGTGQVAWVVADETSSWGEGIRKNYYGKEKKQKKYKLAMQQVGAGA